MLIDGPIPARAIDDYGRGANMTCVKAEERSVAGRLIFEDKMDDQIT
jgi:hypothetical protein